MQKENNLKNLKEQLAHSEKLLADDIKEIGRLERRANYIEKSGKKNFEIARKQNRELEKQHKSNMEEIDKYNSQIVELEKKLSLRKIEIYSLREENKKLKSQNKFVKLPEKINNEPIKIKGVSDIRKSFGFVLKDLKKKKKEGKEDEDIKEEIEEYITPGIDDESKQIEFENLKKIKIYFELFFHELQGKINDYYKNVSFQQTSIGNYKNYINLLNNKVRSFGQDLRISIGGQNMAKFLKSNKSEKITKDLESILFTVNKVNVIITLTKNGALKKGENILHNIQTKLIEIDTNKNLTYNYLANRIDAIQIQIDNLKKLCQALEKIMNNILDYRDTIEEKIDELKSNFEHFMEEYKEDRKKIEIANNKIRKSIKKKSSKHFEDENKNKENEENVEEKEDNEDIYSDEENQKEEDKDSLQASTLIGINDFGKNMNLFKSTVLFQNNNDIEENYSPKAQMLKKNFHEVCYIYDDYDIHDINFELKAIGLEGYSFFNNCSYGFYMGKDIEIIDLEVNDKNVKYDYRNYSVNFDITLRNLQTAKIHLKYKEKPMLESLSSDEIENQQFYRQEYYGLSETLAGQMGKFRLILKGSFDIVSFKEDIFMRNETNKKEKEYLWGGKIPEGGKRTVVMLSKNEATWSFNFSTQIASRRGNLQSTTLKVPMGFVGGNNVIIDMEYSSPQTKNIVVDEETRFYEINYKNTNYSEGEFILKGKIKNRCQGEWEVDLSDDMIERNMYSEDKRDKNKLEKIAKKIIEDFDRKNKDNIHNYMDYAKIGKWVNENIRYDLNYSGRTEMTAMDIYNKKVGVCHHMTRLANALLYSIGYKVIYTHGFACKTSGEFDSDSAHAWSLINVGGKWYPFDATWNILSGKLPVSHIFQGFFDNSIGLVGSDGAYFSEANEETGKFIK